MHDITDLVLAVQQANHEFMAWHDKEHRLLTQISRPKLDALKQEILRGRALRRAAIAEGETAGKEYRQLSAHLSSLEGELSDLEVVAEELEADAFERSCSGQDLWRKHLKERARLANTYIGGLIAADQDEARTELTKLLPLLGRLVARGVLKQQLGQYMQDETQKILPDRSGMIEKAPPHPLDIVSSLLSELLNPVWHETNPEVDPAIMTEIKNRPATNMIRGDLVGSDLKRQRTRKLKEASMTAPTSPFPMSDEQIERARWTPEAMLDRRVHLREL